MNKIICYLLLLTVLACSTDLSHPLSNQPAKHLKVCTDSKTVIKSKDDPIVRAVNTDDTDYKLFLSSDGSELEISPKAKKNSGSEQLILNLQSGQRVLLDEAVCKSDTVEDIIPQF